MEMPEPQIGAEAVSSFHPNPAESPMTAKRNRRKQTQSLQERLAAFAESARERARALPPGKERELLLQRAKQNEMTSNLTDWLSAPVYPRRGNDHA